jgi:pyroglutamyl-peptidase
MDSENSKVTVLLTGFEPFGGEKVNPSMQIVKRLSKKHFQNIHIETLILPVSYEKSTKVLEEYYKNHYVDFVLHLGQAGGTSAIRIERVAINLLDSRHPDNDGQIKRETPILENGPDGYMTRINVREITNFLNAKKYQLLFLTQRVSIFAMRSITTHSTILELLVYQNTCYLYTFLFYLSK